MACNATCLPDTLEMPNVSRLIAISATAEASASKECSPRLGGAGLSTSCCTQVEPNGLAVLLTLRANAPGAFYAIKAAGRASSQHGETTYVRPPWTVSVAPTGGYGELEQRVRLLLPDPGLYTVTVEQVSTPSPIPLT